jgi:hypothetical protein
VSAPRALATFLAGMLAAGILASAGRSLPPPPLAGLDELEVWWRVQGTPVAVLATVRLMGLALSVYLTALGAIAALAAITRWSWAEGLTRTVSTAGARRFLLGGGLVASLSVSSVGASTSPTVFDLTDIGEAGSGFEIRDLGPETVDPLPRSSPEVSPDPPPRSSPEVSLDPPRTSFLEVSPDPPRTSFLEPLEVPALDIPRSSPAITRPDAGSDATWIVERGDHLWRIAAETVADRDLGRSEETIVTYWLALIELNRDVIGDDPDLIHPGQVIRLPDRGISRGGS